MPKKYYDAFELRAKKNDNEDDNDMSDNEEFVERCYQRDYDIEDEISEEDDDVFYQQSEDKIAKDLETRDDDVLLSVAAGLLARDSERGFLRRTCSLPEGKRVEARGLWKHSRQPLSSLYICSECEKILGQNESCCGDVARFTRVNVQSQLGTIVKYNIEDIISVRNQLPKNDHSLTGKQFELVRKDDSDRELTISLVGSIDGCQPSGHTNSKIWPISFMIVDLQSHESQKSHNIVLGGIVDGKKNPSTSVWNVVMKLIHSEITQFSMKVSGRVVKFSLVTMTADQPAKRYLFGMKSFQSAESCFFCLSPETRYKLHAPERHQARPGSKTEQDAERGVRGFGQRNPWIVKVLKPFETPIDQLHNYCEGIFATVIRECLTEQRKVSNRMLFRLQNRDSFVNFTKLINVPQQFRRCTSLRNGNEKGEVCGTDMKIHIYAFQYFCVFVLPNAILANDFNVTARFLLTGLGLLFLGEVTAISVDREFFDEISSALGQLLKDNENYLSIKLHEIVYHSGISHKLFGNAGLLSTSSFETFYRYLLSDFPKAMTKNFVQIAITRFIMRRLVLSEVRRRSQIADASRSIKEFISLMPETGHTSDRLIGKSIKLSAEDGLYFPEGYAEVSLPVGRLVSMYKKPDTTNDCIFFAHCGTQRCGLFRSAAEDNGQIWLTCQLFVQQPSGYLYENLRESIKTIPSRENQRAAVKILNVLKRSHMIVQATLSTTRVLIKNNDVLSMASRTTLGGAQLIVALNGSAIHK